VPVNTNNAPQNSAPQANASVQLAANPSKPITLLANSTSVAAPDPLASFEMTQRLLVDGKPSEFVFLRDPQFDQYLLAHQRFSPSVYSTAQYARSAAFANDKDK